MRTCVDVDNRCDASPLSCSAPAPHDIDNANANPLHELAGSPALNSSRRLDDLWEWSVRDLGAFWSAVWEYYGVAAIRRHDHIVSTDAMPNTRGTVEVLESGARNS
jgi:hypothetical protein